VDKKQQIDSHSWEVAVILLKIYPECSKELLAHALTHDSGEIHTSDIAAPVKRMKPELKVMLDELEEIYMTEELGLDLHHFSEEERLALKYADYISGVYYTTTRSNAGDIEALKIRDKFLEYLDSLAYLNEAAEAAILEVQNGAFN
jgi:5'-deoxynucleotidase YfbR-like HD superfamily hydrolase